MDGRTERYDQKDGYETGIAGNVLSSALSSGCECNGDISPLDNNSGVFPLVREGSEQLNQFKGSSCTASASRVPEGK